jgi:hypothetical protein
MYINGHQGLERRELGVTAVSHLLSAFTDLPVLHISYEWSHAPCDLLCLASSTRHVFKVYLCCKMYQYFIPYSTTWIYHVLLIHQ